jgi:microsomal dipeptidase-like Zn-dependent dipeptidase
MTMNSDDGSLSDTAPRVPLGGDYWRAEPQAPLWGFADLHAHLMAHLAFGGKAFWGQPYDPEHPGEAGMPHVMGSCAPYHGGLININPEFGHPAAGGWPEFIVWPRFTTIIHQQAYIDWLYRAYQGGLRLITCLAVNNELLASKSSPGNPGDDKSAIQAQVAGMKNMAATIDQQAGGPGKGWLEIAYSPEDAARIIAANRLAVILGVEVDSLGNWHREEDFEALCQGSPQRARELIGAELDWLHDLGIRQITPIHLANNAFGGTAIYMRFLETVNLFLSGERWEVEDASPSGVRYRLDQDGVNLVDGVERTLAILGPRMRSMTRQTLIDYIPGVQDLADANTTPLVKGGHANSRGLNSYGRILLEEMMARGMIIDVDHMSQKTIDAALAMVEALHYPVICSHTWFRDLLFSGTQDFDAEDEAAFGTSDVHKVAHEAGKRGDQIERIARLGGVVAPILNQGDFAGLKRALPALADKLPAPNAGASTAWGQAYLYAVNKMGGRGVAMGSDINGAAGLPGPRFGPFASYGARNDAVRSAQRRAEIEQQANGVAYLTPMRDHRWHRFDSPGEGGYDDQECDIWQAIAQYEAGFNPLTQSHLPSDYPEPSLDAFLKALQWSHNQEWVDNMTRGFWIGKQEVAGARRALIARWPVEQKAGYLYFKPELAAKMRLDPLTKALIAKIGEIWGKWRQMSGDNTPLVRSTAGEHRDFDINLDGMAHYGMLPDLLQDLRNSGLQADDFAPLFRSAYDYVQMWVKCSQRAAELRKAAASPASAEAPSVAVP